MTGLLSARFSRLPEWSRWAWLMITASKLRGSLGASSSSFVP